MPAEIDFSDIEEKYKVVVPTTFDNIVVIDNLPVVDGSKEEKLINVVKKIFKNVGTIKENGIQMPMGPNGKSKGFLFMQFETAAQAKLAITQADGHRLDKSHVLSVFAFDDVETYTQMDDEYVEPEIEEYQPKEHLKSWLMDPRARDQFAIMKGDDVTVYWNNKAEQPDKVKERTGWSDSYISWSPLGSYLVTLHNQGIALWGGASWEKITRFLHPNAQKVEFSPNEKYVITWSHEPFKTIDGQLHNLCVWDVLTTTLLRSFPTDKIKDKGVAEWPIMKWSHDGKYIAKCTTGPQGAISVYETPSMGLLDKKSIKIENLLDFYWSPSTNMISYWTPEIGNIPARVTLLDIPSRNIVRTKNFFNVIDCKLFWQASGEYLLVRVDRNKTKTTTVTSFEVFRMLEKDIPVDVVELKVTEDMTDLFWEPKGNRFALLLTENQTQRVKFFEVQANNASSAASAGVKELKDIDAKGVNRAIWSPKGRFCVLAGVQGLQGDLQFWDVDDLCLMGTGEHYMCTDIEWDPTGRYVVSSISFWSVPNDNGLVLWTLTGQELVKQNMTGLKQFLWRPRPKTLLSAKEQKKIKKNLKDYSRDFDEDDAMESNKASAEVQAARRAMWAEYKNMLAKYEESHQALKSERIELYGFDPDEINTDEAVAEIVEELVEEIEEVIE
ncbi:eukaryotic translation initiation factor eIF2A-domain-containing protein [Globomyces pollinis-pini]|nr:eukaryotic translation initiation factor eIF2A-domain-containing protein [Globomyces pollinis-pini]